MDLLVDTNILVDHLRGLPQATAWLRQVRRSNRLWLSALTIAEIHAGQKMKQPAEAAKVKRLLQFFRVAYLDGTTAAQGGAFARDYGVALPDALIAATAVSKGMPVVTRNVKHFAVIPGLQIQTPY